MSTGKTLADFVDTLEQRGDATAFFRMKREGSARQTYSNLASDTLALARGLYGRTDKEARIGLFAAPGFESIAAVLAVIRSGSSVVLLDVQLADEVLKNILADCGAKLVFTTRRYAERLESIVPDITLGILDAENDEEVSWKRFFSQEGDLPELTAEQEATLFYTSGTTGPPKGVPLSHENLVFQLDTVAQTGLIGEGDKMLLPLPLHHVYPFVIGILVPLSMGLTIVLPNSLTGPQILRAIGEGGVTVILGVPRLYSAIFSGISSKFTAKGFLGKIMFGTFLKLSVALRKKRLRVGRLMFRPLHKKIGPSLNILASGGSPLDPDLAWNLEGLGWNVAIGYGLTETSPLLTLNPPGSGRVGSVGPPIQDVELWFDPSAIPQEDSESEKKSDQKKGEILAKGPGVFSGYLNLPEKTAEAFSDGWFKTGDLGYQDKEGYVYVTGRVSTLIVTEGGENIQPDHVEKALEDHPLIKEAGVLQKNGKLTALLVPDPAEIRKIETDDIRKAVSQAVTEQARKLPSYQRIEDFALARETLPRTRLGKIKRHILEDRYESARKEDGEKQEAGPIAPEEMSDQDRAFLENDAAWHTWEWLSERYKDQRLTPDTSLRLDLGVDSMEWLNLTMEIREKIGAEITDEAIGNIETVRDLLKEVMEASEGETTPASLDDPEKIVSEKQKKFIRPPGPVTKYIAAAVFKFNRLLMKLIFRVKVKGEENIPEGQVVFTPNHVSYLDPFVLASALKNERLKNTFWAGLRRAALRNPLNRAVSRLAKTIPVDPRKGVFSALASAAIVIKRGDSLIWFPEGRRSPSGELQSFRPGIGVLLERYEVPVVPVFIRGTQKAMPVGKIIPTPAKVVVAFGEPVFPEQLKQKGEGKEIKDKIADGLQKSVAEVSRKY